MKKSFLYVVFLLDGRIKCGNSKAVEMWMNRKDLEIVAVISL